VPERTVLRQNSGHTPAAEDDNALIARTATGDRLAYASLVRRHLPRLLAVARRMLGSDFHAEDAAQEALIKVWTHAASFEPVKARFTTWLTRIAMNICLDRLRKRGEEPWPENFDVAVASQQDHDLMRGQVSARVGAALQALPDRQRQALILCHYEELSMVDAAEIMETTAEAIESLLARARRALKRQLESEWRSLIADGEDGGIVDGLTCLGTMDGDA
jgi:RNA polymerase sigma-70 factor, ECF subfamily